MPLPKVAIVGRPNVGKSSLFNALAGVRIAIVEPTPGVTRDRLATPIEIDEAGRYVELIDTGGIGIIDAQELEEDVEQQISYAIAEADLILFTLDARDGLTPLDQQVAERLRATGKPILCVVNKCDTDRIEADAQNFRALGWPTLFVSAHQGRGRGELREAVAAALGEKLKEATAPEPAAMKLAIVGRRNVGKSTFINALAQAERVIVSEVAGTTRDSVDVRFERDGLAFIAIDTAGVRKKGSVADSIEFYSMARAERSIRRADVVLQFFDPNETVGTVDKQLADYILRENKPAIFVVNKWDLAKKQTDMGAWADYLRKMFPNQDYVPISFITAKDGKNVYRVLNLAQNLFKQATSRVATGELNRVVREALARRPPPVRKNRAAKIYYATQAAVQPPTVICFTSGPELFDEWYRRYLLRQLRDHLPFAEVPIKLHLRSRSETEAEEDDKKGPPNKLMGRPRKKAKPAAAAAAAAAAEPAKAGRKPRLTTKTAGKVAAKAGAKAKRAKRKKAADGGVWKDI